jgi:hypothetical protein
MIGLILTLALLGLVLYLIETYIPMDPTIKVLIRIVVVVCVIYWLIGVFGIADMPIPRMR